MYLIFFFFIRFIFFFSLPAVQIVMLFTCVNDSSSEDYKSGIRLNFQFTANTWSTYRKKRHTSLVKNLLIIHNSVKNKAFISQAVYWLQREIGRGLTNGGIARKKLGNQFILKAFIW